MEVATRCGLDQTLAVPIAATLGVCALAVYARYAKLTSNGDGPAHDWVRLRASELLDTAHGQSTVSEEGACGAAKDAARAIRDDRVLYVDLPRYLSTRTDLHIVSKLLAVACAVAAVQVTSSDLIFATCRLLLLALIWGDHTIRTAPLHHGSGTSFGERFLVHARLASNDNTGLSVWYQRPSVSQATVEVARLSQARRDIAAPAMQCLRAPSIVLPLPGRWMRLAILHAASLGCLAWFVLAKQPSLQKQVCPTDSLQVSVDSATSLLAAERAGAVTLMAAWFVFTLSHLLLLRCEACVWMAPRTERLLAERLQTNHGSSLLNGRAVVLAEALCGPQALAESLLQELHQVCGVIVLSSCLQLQLTAEPPRPLMREDMLKFQDQLNTELKRCNDLNEERLSDVLRATEAVLHCCERHEKRVVSLESRSRQQQPPQRRSRSLQIHRKSQITGAAIARAVATRTESCSKLPELGLSMMQMPLPAAADTSEDDAEISSKLFDGRAMQLSTTDGGTGAGSHVADTEASATSIPAVHPPPPLPLEPPNVRKSQPTPNSAGRPPSFEDAAHFSASSLPRPVATKLWAPGAGASVDGAGTGPPAASCASSSSTLPSAPHAAAVPAFAREVSPPGGGNALPRSSRRSAVGADGAISATGGGRRSSRATRVQESVEL